MSNLSVEYVDLDDLPADPRNPKSHDLDTIIESIVRFGFADPMVVDERTGRIAAGHGRVEALRTLRDSGSDPPTGVQANGEGVWKVPTVVGWASENDDEAAAALVALNRLTERGGWDDRALLDLLDQLDEVSDLSGVGFDTMDLDDLRAKLDEIESDGVAGVTVVDDESYDDFLERYADRGVRTVLLDYRPEVYEWMIDTFDRLREDDESNADLVLRVVEDVAGESAPEVDDDA